jgi:hypothetical protein
MVNVNEMSRCKSLLVRRCIEKELLKGLIANYEKLWQKLAEIHLALAEYESSGLWLPLP